MDEQIPATDFAQQNAPHRIIQKTREIAGNLTSIDEQQAQYAMLNASSTANDKRGDNEYFHRLAETIRSHASAFYRYLLEYDLTDFNIRAIPETTIREAIRESTKPTEQRFHDEVLSDKLPADRFITSHEMYVLYERFCTSNGISKVQPLQTLVKVHGLRFL